MAADLDQTLEQLLQQELTSKIQSSVEEAVAGVREACEQAVEEATQQARHEAGGELAVALNECVQRIRKEDSVTGIATALVDGAAGFGSRGVLFIHRGQQLLGFRAAGAVTEEQQTSFQKLSLGVNDGTALRRAVDSLSHVEASGTPAELTGHLVEALALEESDRFHLFPITLREKVLAVLGCDGKSTHPEEEPAPLLIPAIETLIALSEAWIEAVGTRRKQTAA